ncbi:hypothetical protein BDC45DRAFT_508338 [Circinella umbellata]|nr:hypothetical protein BDC45DRAFT_508338 [Circinella umbellata]
MSSSNLDDALRDLEKQVIDFSLAVEDETNNNHVNTTLSTNNSTTAIINNNKNLDTLTMQRQANMDRQPTPNSFIGTSDEDDDDNVCVAELRHRAKQQQQQQQQYHTASRSNTVKGTRSRNVPTTASTVSSLKRSVSSGGAGNKQFKISEPVPPLPPNLIPLMDQQQQQQQQQQQPRNDDDHDLKAAVQTAWAVLEAGGDNTINDNDNNNNNPINPTPKTTDTNHSPQTSINKVTAGVANTNLGAPMKTLTLRIYINDGTKHKTVQLTNLLTSAMVVQYFRKKGLLLDSSEDWTLFEVDYSHDIERPLRDWEIVMDTTSTWEHDTKSYLVVKKYKYRDSLMADSVLQKLYPPNYGWLTVEFKKGRWQRRFFYIMDNTIHHAKDNKGTGSIPLCHLSSFDVYTMLHHVRGSPTEFVFALRAQDKPHIFERPEDYMYLLAADDYDALRQWVLSIRSAKNMYHYQLYPHRVINPLGPIDAPSSTTTDVPPPSSRTSPNGDDVPLVTRNNTLRRYKSTKELRSTPSFSPNEEAIKNNGGLSRHGSRRGTGGGRGTDGPLINPFDRESFAKGSLLANSSENESAETTPRHSPIPPPSLPVAEELQQQSQTLIQIEDRVKFSKGSLLDKSVHGSNGNMSNSGPTTMGTSGLSRSKSSRETSSHHYTNEVAAGNGEGNTRRQMSVRRKPTTSRSNRRPEVPAMPTTPSVPSTGPLLQQDEDPEQAHTRRLMERQIKPLVNFNSPSSGFNPSRRY